MRISSKGRITVPADIRRRANLLPGTEVDVVLVDDVVQLRRVEFDADRGKRVVEQLRRHRGDIGMSTDEIMALMRGDEE